MTSDSPRATWRVDSQTPRTRADSTGNVNDGYDIAFTTGQGHHGTLFVAMSKYNPASVRDAIQAQADMIDAVGALSSDG